MTNYKNRFLTVLVIICAVLTFILGDTNEAYASNPETEVINLLKGNWYNGYDELVASITDTHFNGYKILEIQGYAIPDSKGKYSEQSSGNVWYILEKGARIWVDWYGREGEEMVITIGLAGSLAPEVYTMGSSQARYLRKK